MESSRNPNELEIIDEFGSVIGSSKRYTMSDFENRPSGNILFDSNTITGRHSSFTHRDGTERRAASMIFESGTTKRIDRCLKINLLFNVLMLFAFAVLIIVGTWYRLSYVSTVNSTNKITGSFSLVMITIRTFKETSAEVYEMETSKTYWSTNFYKGCEGCTDYCEICDA